MQVEMTILSHPLHQSSTRPLVLHHSSTPSLPHSNTPSLRCCVAYISLMKRTIFVDAILAGFALIARADYLIKERFEQAGRIEEITLKIKGSKVRLDTGEQSSALI